jgi:hypothetical protein
MWLMEILAYALRLTIVIGVVIALMLGIIAWTQKSNRKKVIRYFRWSVRGAFLILFMIPIAYLVGGPSVPVYSYLSDGANKSLFMVPLGQSPCLVWLASWGQTAYGNRIVDPIWALQSFLAGGEAITEVLPVIGAMLLFIVPIFVLGNMFCSWICPTGTVIDSFDKVVEKSLPKVDAKRVERSKRNKETRAKRQTQSSNPLCPTCPLGRLSGRYGLVANGVLVSSLVGSAALKFPVFCAVCPIGISTRGASHLASIASVTGKFLPFISRSGRYKFTRKKVLVQESMSGRCIVKRCWSIQPPLQASGKG